jgi:hypothetical protein
MHEEQDPAYRGFPRFEGCLPRSAFDNSAMKQGLHDRHASERLAQSLGIQIARA